MKPYLLKGHERPLTYLKYNREGDLLFSCSKDSWISLWFSENGFNIGTFNGHNGAIYQCDVTYESEYLITASADSTVRLWEVETGKELVCFQYRVPCRATSFSLGDELAVVTTDVFLENSSSIRIIRIAKDQNEQKKEDIMKIDVDRGRIPRALFYDVNRQLITAHEDGSVRRWDVETGKCIQTVCLHESAINDLKFDVDCTHFLTASSDNTSKLVDADKFQVLKTYQAERPINAVDMSPIFEHIVLGGGQDAAQVTTTTARAGKFESVFFHKVYNEKLGSVRGHFGPINTIAFHPNGRSFSTGGEDGYVRIQHFDNDYFAL